MQLVFDHDMIWLIRYDHYMIHNEPFFCGSFYRAYAIVTGTEYLGTEKTSFFFSCMNIFSFTPLNRFG